MPVLRDSLFWAQKIWKKLFYIRSWLSICLVTKLVNQ